MLTNPSRFLSPRVLFRGVLIGIMLTSASCSGTQSDRPVITLAPPTSSTSTAAPSATAPGGTPSPTTGPTTQSPPESNAITIALGDDWGEVVDAAPEGSSFVVDPGVHRLQTVVPKDGMSFVGMPGAVMSGAVLLDGFVAEESVWRLDGIVLNDFQHGVCIGGYEGCRLSQDLFMDDVMLWQVTEFDDLEPSAWYWDGESIYVANDPTERRVELSTRDYAFAGSAADVTISDLKIEKYATPAQAGTLQAQEPGDGARGESWVISNVEVTGSHGVGIRTGDATLVTGSFVHHNGQMGIAVSGGTDVVLDGNEIAFNNIAGFDWTWEGGGMKATRTQNLVVRNNYSHDNIGPGLWTDIDAMDTLYESNRVVDNSAAGIFHEISGSAVIRDNTVEGNGFGKPQWLWGAGILIAASSDVDISGNTVAGNADGIAGIQQDRQDGPGAPYLLEDMRVYGNTIEMAEGQTGVVDDTGGSDIYSDRNILFSDNTYIDIEGRRFAWDGRVHFKEGWMDAGQDVDATWVNG